jgi:hypothetical protein
VEERRFSVKDRSVSFKKVNQDDEVDERKYSVKSSKILD